MDVSAATVRQSVKTLFCLPTRGKKKRNVELVPTDDRVELVIAAKKIPQMSRVHVGRFVLPYAMYNSESNVCLFVKDEDGRKNREFDEREKYLKKLKDVGIEEVKEVMPVRQLKFEFKPFEAKRRLSDAFDGYLGDERIYSFLRPLLGKHFHSRHRFPVSTRLTSGNLAKGVRKALRTTLLTVTKQGPCSMLPVGITTVNTEDEIVENIMAVWNQMDKEFPGGRKNVRSLSIKTAHSTSVPVYSDLNYLTEVPVPDLRDYHEEPEPEEIDTVSGAKVMVYPDGRVRLIRKPKKSGEDNKDDEEGKQSSSEDEDDRLVKKLIDRDEEAEARRKRKLVRKGGQKSSKKSRPLLAAHAKTEKATKHEKL